MSTLPTESNAAATAAAVIIDTESKQPTNDIPNPKFKTALCKNFISSSCSRQTGCHFAHGSEELRAVSENSGFFDEVEKPNTDYLDKWPTNIPTNYKTTLCKFYEQVGTCKYDQNCNFAHGDQEKRQISESVQTQLKSGRNTNKHINNSAGQKNSSQIQMNQFMMEQSMIKQYIQQMAIAQSTQLLSELCARILGSAPSDEYVKKTVKDIQKLLQELKFEQCLKQVKKLCSRKDANQAQKDILKEVEKYSQKPSTEAQVAKAN